ncbi:MAG TPA: hypothetical protein VFU94_05860 [Conexibacter sp.]|nr:hypothetical protein [Conexibacter sp.]
MTLRKVLIVACAAALTTSPAWAHPGRSQNAPGSGGTTGQDAPTGTHGHGRGTGHSHRCAAHRVGYVAAGTLVSQTLALDASSTSDHPTYSGDVTIAVTRTNHQARGDKGTTKTYTLAHARVVLGLADQNNDGSVGLDDLAANDRVKVVGKVTVLRRKCDQTGFTPTVTVRQLIVHAPASQQQPTG